MWPDRRLFGLFGIELPIVLAPMANFAGVDMAIAVAAAGGLGSLPCAALNPDQIRAGVAAFRLRAHKPLNLNFFCHVEAPRDLEKDRAWLRRSRRIIRSLASKRRPCRYVPGIRLSMRRIVLRSRRFAPRS